MKKIILIVLLFYGQLFALERESTLKFYQHLFSSISGVHPIMVYVEDPEYKDVFGYAKNMLLANTVKSADVILVTDARMLERVLKQKESVSHTDKKMILFATNYRLLKASKEVVGAFYWKKGRTQLLFVKDRLKVHGIVLSDEYKRFIVDEL